MVVCKRAKHPNILSIEGVAPRLFEFCMVSRWMENGNILSFVTKYPAVNRLELVRPMRRRSGTELIRANVDDWGYPRSRVSPQQRSCPWRSQERTWRLCSFFLQLTYPTPSRISWLIREAAPAFPTSVSVQSPRTSTQLTPRLRTTAARSGTVLRSFLTPMGP